MMHFLINGMKINILPMEYDFPHGLQWMMPLYFFGHCMKMKFLNVSEWNKWLCQENARLPCGNPIAGRENIQNKKLHHNHGCRCIRVQLSKMYLCFHDYYCVWTPFVNQTTVMIGNGWWDRSQNSMGLSMPLKVSPTLRSFSGIGRRQSMSWSGQQFGQHLDNPYWPLMMEMFVFTGLHDSWL